MNRILIFMIKSYMKLVNKIFQYIDYYHTKLIFYK